MTYLLCFKGTTFFVTEQQEKFCSMQFLVNCLNENKTLLSEQKEANQLKELEKFNIGG